MNVYTETKTKGRGSSTMRLATLLSVVALALLYSCPADGNGTSTPLPPSIVEEIKDKDPAILYNADMHENAQSLFSRGDIDNPYLFTFGVTSIYLIEALSAELTITGDTNNDGEVEELYQKNMPLNSFTASNIPLKNSAMLKKRMYVMNNDVFGNGLKSTTVNAISPVYKENDYIVGIGLTEADPVDFDTLPEDITISAKIFYKGKDAKLKKGTLLKEETIQVSKADPYKIYTWRDLQHIQDDLTGNYVVQNDIIFPEVGHYDYENFRPIGWPVKPRRALKYDSVVQTFTGTFEGNNHKIEGLRIVHDGWSIGLFARANATIQNFTLYHSGVIGGYVEVGSIVGRLEGGTIDNVHVYALDGAEVTGETWVGGLIGGVLNAVAIIKNSSAHVDVRATRTYKNGGGNSGGLIGVMMSATVGDKLSGTVSNSYATGDVYGLEDVGGLIGEFSGSSTHGAGAFTGIYATGNVKGKQHVGGLIGRLGGSEIFISGYATGKVQGDSYIGGLIGSIDLDGEAFSLTGYSTGKVDGCTAVGGTIGGLIFRRVKTSLAEKKIMRVNGYSTGDISGCSRVGGFIGSALPKQYNTPSQQDISWNKWATALNNNIYDMRGYTRGKIIITDRNADTIGLFLGNLYNAESPIGTLAGYISSLSTVVGAVQDTSGIDGDKIDISKVTSENYRGIFQKLTFGDKVGQWTWVGDGKWPAVNIGDVAPAEEQPLE